LPSAIGSEAEIFQNGQWHDQRSTPSIVVQYSKSYPLTRWRINPQLAMKKSRVDHSNADGLTFGGADDRSFEKMAINLNDNMCKPPLRHQLFWFLFHPSIASAVWFDPVKANVQSGNK
jgi:hypothetical protein